MVTPDDGLEARLRSDLTAAMRARDTRTTATLRMVLTAVRAAEVSGSTARTLSDDEVLGVLRSEAKKRREAAEAFEAADRPERVEAERAEEEVLAAYLPSQLSDAELEDVVREEVADAEAAGATGMSAMGRVMGAVRRRVGQRADGGRVAAVVRRHLTGG